LRKPKRATIASIADMQFRFDMKGSGFDLKILGADREGRDVEVTLTGQMAIGVVNGVVIAMEQNAQRAAAIAAGAKAAEPEIRTISESRFAH
jgi:hypothetical protein